MTEAPLTPQHLKEVSAFIEKNMGLSFPPDRWSDLERALRSVSSELGFSNPIECAEWIIPGKLTRGQLELLATHLTIGETYFFRDQHAYDALERAILPELIAARATNSRLLRFWSAGCCTGEEAYSMAILLDRVLPNIGSWNLTIIATDINPRFLQKARSGAYTSWSFRGMNDSIRKRCFEEVAPGRFEVISRIKEMVTFFPLNLVEDVYPSLATNTNAMDVIFCRNVLMYFSRSQAQKVVRKLSECLVQGAYLFTSAAEASSELFAPLECGTFPETVTYRKVPEAKAPIESPRLVQKLEPAKTVNNQLPPKKAPQMVAVESSNPRETAKSLANEGRLTEALLLCDEAITRDKLDPENHYLRGIILQEQGNIDEAIISLRRALFLDQDLVLARFALANLMLRRRQTAEAGRHLEETRTLLGRYDRDAVLANSDGLTAGRLLSMLDAMQEVTG